MTSLSGDFESHMKPADTVPCKVCGRLRLANAASCGVCRDATQPLEGPGKALPKRRASKRVQSSSNPFPLPVGMRKHWT